MHPSVRVIRINQRVPSVKCILSLMVGIAATHVPNNRLLVANRNPTATAGFSFIKEEMFLIIQIIVRAYCRNRLNKNASIAVA
jgi:hypothetical protein